MPYATRVSYVAAAGDRDFDVTFPYLDASHVEVTVAGLPQSTAAYEWIGNNRIRFATAVAGGSVVTLKRHTPLDHALVQFRNGSVLAEDELNRAITQTLYVQQELVDLYTYSLDNAQVRLGNNLSVVTTPDQIMDDLAALVLADDLLVDLVNRIQGGSDVAALIIKEALRGVELKRGVNAVRERVTTVETTSELMASVLNLLAIVAEDGQSMVLREDKVYRGNGDSYAQAFTQIETNFGDQSASISSLSVAQADTSGSLAQLRTILGAYNGTQTAFILNESTVKRTNGQTLGETFSGIVTQFATATASITANATAISTESGARASAISGLTATVNGYSASITNLQTVQTGLGAKWGVVLNVNGHISGIVTNNNGSSSDFNIVADKFRIVAPGGGTPITVFQTDGAYAAFANPVTITAGTYKLVIGPAFGAASNLILWYGPSSVGVTSCSTANAIFALTISGTYVIPSSGGAPFSVNISSPAVSGGRLGNGFVETSVVTVTPVNGSGSYTYQWVIGNQAIGISAPANYSTVFNTNITTGQTKEGFAVCTVTDTGTGKQVQVTIHVLLTEFS